MGLFRAAWPWVLLWVGILAPRAVNFVRVSVPAEPSCELERAAACLARHGYLGAPYPGYNGPTAHVAPLYPTVLAAVYALFGDGRTGHQVQAGLTILVVGIGISFMPRLGRVLCGSPAAGWLAAGLMCLLPLSTSFIQFTGMFEQPWTFTAAAAYLPLLVGFDRGGWRNVWTAAGLGLATGVCILLTPQFAAVFGLFAAFEIVGRSDRKVRIVRLVLAAAIAGLVIAPWTVRNYRVLGGWCFVRSNMGLELAIGNNDWANGYTMFGFQNDPEHPDNPFNRLHPHVSEAQVEELKATGELEYMRRRAAEAERWVREHPARWAELTATRVRLFWFPPPEMWAARLSNWPPPGARSWLYGGMNLVAAVGLFRLAVRDVGAFAVAAAGLIGLSVAYYFTHVDVRYSFPTHGIVLVLAADAILWVVRAVFRSGADADA